jgi:hypothetical protein
MGCRLPTAVELNDELALLCNLPLSIRYLVVSFGQTLLKGSGVHSASYYAAWTAMRRRTSRQMPFNIPMVGIVAVTRAAPDTSGACGKWRSGVSHHSAVAH